MDARAIESCTAFADTTRIASGPPRDVALALKSLLDRGDARTILVFNDANGRIVEFDLRGSAEEITSRLEPVVDTTPRSPGRPKLGVVGKEVTLLPRHWEWLGEQRGGASVTLRKLVETARRDSEPADSVRHAQEVAFRFMNALAGDLPGFEEATRALFAGDSEGFDANSADWAPDVRDYARQLAADALPVLWKPEQALDRSFVVRVATPGDAEALQRFATRLFTEGPPGIYSRDIPTVEEELDFIASRITPANSTLLLAVAGDEIVGVMDFLGRSAPQEAHGGAFGISVDREHRGKGIGSALLEAIESWARAHGIRRIEANAFANNPRAVQLYERHGFTQEGRRREAVEVNGEYIDAFVLAKLVDGYQPCGRATHGGKL